MCLKTQYKVVIISLKWELYNVHPDTDTVSHTRICRSHKRNSTGLGGILSG